MALTRNVGRTDRIIGAVLGAAQGFAAVWFRDQWLPAVLFGLAGLTLVIEAGVGH